MSAATREALWAREKAERATPAPKPVTRIRYDGKVVTARPGRWCVVKKNDDGRMLAVRTGLSYLHADALAGRLRDRESDADVAAGWNYLPWPSRKLAREVVRIRS